MNNRINRLTLSVLLAFGLLLVFATGIVSAQGPDGPHGKRELPPITEENVTDFTIEELTAPETWEQLIPREQRIVLEAIEAEVMSHAQSQEEEALANGVNWSLYIWEASTGLYDPTYEPGSYFLYQIWLRNTGTDDATGVRLTYTPPVSVSVSGSFNDRNTPYSQNGDLVWDVGTVESGGDRNFYVEMQVYPTVTVGVNLISTATVTCTQVMTPEQETETDAVSGPTLNVTKRILQNSPGCLNCHGGYDDVKTGSEIIYHVKVENESVITDAQTLVVTDTLPADVTFVSASDSGVYSAAIHSVVWNAGTLDKGQSRSFLVTVQTPPTASLSLNNVVTASASTSTGSYSHQATTQGALEPNVGVHQYPDWNNVPAAGNMVQLNIYVDNHGFSQQQVLVENVVATTTLESGLEYVSSYVRDGWGRMLDIAATTNISGDETTVTWELGALPNDPTGTTNNRGIYLQARLPSTAGAGDTFTATTAVTTTTQPEADTNDNEAQTIITALASHPDLKVSKSGCSSPHPGGWCYYDLLVYNDGTVPITDAVLIDYLPVGLTAFGGGDTDDYDPVVGDATWGPGTLSFGRQVVTWTLKPIMPGGSTSMELFVRVSDALAVGHTLTNTAIVTRTTILSDVNPGNNKSVHTTRVTADADLYVSKYGWYGSKWAQPGDDVKYTVYLKNYSTVLAENTVMTDVVLFHASLVTATADEGIEPHVDLAGDVATWDVGNFSGYPYPYFYVTTQVDSDLDVGQSFANLAWATTSSPQSGTDDNYDLDYDTVGILPQKSDVHVYKDLDGCPVPGGVVEFSINVYNSSYTTATNVVVTDTLPVSLTYGGLDYYSGTTVTPTVSGQDVIWNLGDVSPNSSIYFEITATLSSALDPGDVLSNTVRVMTSNEDIGTQDDNVYNSRFAVLGSPYTDLQVYKEHDEEYIRSGSSNYRYIALARRGQPFDYEIWVNHSGCPAEDVVVRDVLPDGMTFVSASPTPTIRSGQVMTWNLGTVEQYGTRIAVTVRPDAAAGEFLWNHVYASSSTYDYDTSNNAFVFITGVNESAFVYLPLVLRNY